MAVWPRFQHPWASFSMARRPGELGHMCAGAGLNLKTCPACLRVPLHMLRLVLMLP